MTAMNKGQMMEFISKNLNEVKDENLVQRIVYTSKAWEKNPESVKLTDLRPLVKEIKAILPKEEPKAEKPVVENSVKKAKKVKKAEPAKEETPVEETETAKAKKPVAKKQAKKKATKKEDPVVIKSAEAGKYYDLAKSFKDTFKFKDIDGTFVKATDIETFSDLREAVNEDSNIYIAVYWTPRLLKQFGYSSVPAIKTPKAFEHDLDFVSIIFIGDTDTVAVGISSYTDAPYLITPDSLERDKDTGLRYNLGAEYEIYRLVEEEPEEDLEEDAE